LSTVPTEDLSGESVVETPENMMMVLNGIHRLMYSPVLSGQGYVGLGAQMRRADALGEDYVFTQNTTWDMGVYRWENHRSATSAHNNFPWVFSYQIIRNANVIIHGEDVVVGAQEMINIPIGQAYVYRAFGYFQLIQLYSQRYQGGTENTQVGVPLVLSPSNDAIPPSTVEEVYSQIHMDLTAAIERLAIYSRPNKSHLDASIAKGLKARVYLTQQDWENAVHYARLAREGYPLMSMAEYTSGFNDYSNSEWMWGSHVSGTDQGHRFGHFGAYNSRNFNSANIRTNPKAINSNLYNSFPESDIRLSNFDPTGLHEDLNLPSTYFRAPYTSQKFLAYGVEDSRMDVPYMRSAEMYLIEAEALANLGDYSDAAQILYDLVSSRDPEYVLSTNTGQDLLEEIYLNRRLELWGEGFRFYDLKRLNQSLDRTGANHIAALIANVFEVPAGDNRWQYRIPQDELNANPYMEQNQ
jgi:starch-binding outer membrane protein, SusD/RagB family